MVKSTRFVPCILIFTAPLDFVSSVICGTEDSLFAEVSEVRHVYTRLPKDDNDDDNDDDDDDDNGDYDDDYEDKDDNSLCSKISKVLFMQSRLQWPLLPVWT